MKKTILALSFVAVFIGGCASMNEPPPAVTHDGLHLVPNTKFAQVYAKPGIDLSQYKTVMVGDCSVSFRKNWLREQNSDSRSTTTMVSKSDMTKIIDRLSEACTNHFKTAVTEQHTWDVVNSDTSTAPTLMIHPSIVNLDINAPDTMSPGINRSYTTTAGEMTLYLELYDATSKEILARVLDRRNDPDNSHLEWTNSVTNKAAADRILTRWSNQLVDGLNQVMAPESQATTNK